MSVSALVAVGGVAPALTDPSSSFPRLYRSDRATNDVELDVDADAAFVPRERRDIQSIRVHDYLSHPSLRPTSTSGAWTGGRGGENAMTRRAIARSRARA